MRLVQPGVGAGDESGRGRQELQESHGVATGLGASEGLKLDMYAVGTCERAVFSCCRPNETDAREAVDNAGTRGTFYSSLVVGTAYNQLLGGGQAGKGVKRRTVQRPALHDRE